MLKALLVTASLGFAPAGDIATAHHAAVHTGADTDHLILVRGGPDRRDPFAELKEQRRQAAERERKAEQELRDKKEQSKEAKDERQNDESQAN